MNVIIPSSVVKLIDSFNESKIFFGMTMMLFNFGSKYLISDISKSQEVFLKSIIIRRLTIFCMFFVATKDFKTSVVMTAAFITVAFGIFDNNSSMCVLPKSLFDDKVTDAEHALAQDIIRKYIKQNDLKV